MALSANTPRTYALGDDNEFGVAASATIYEGSAVGSSGGYARALTAGDVFLGFALAGAVGTSSAGAVTVRVRSRGYIQLSVTSVAVTDIGAPVYASDDGTFVLTAGTAEANTCIGRVHRFVSSGVAIVAFGPGTASITALTDNSGGTASDTLAAITGSYVEATIENTVASLAAKINQIINILGTK